MTCRRHRRASVPLKMPPIRLTDEDREMLEANRLLLARPCEAVYETTSVRCGLRDGHEGNHQSGPFEWTQEQAGVTAKGSEHGGS